jgi:hypothetical protein
MMNPFHDLYLSEAISEDALVRLFSPVIVDYARVIFEPGNVIVRGLQGTGKTMLLNLLRPESRLAYARAKVEFPVRAANFIGAGINLRKCGALEFAQHLEEGAPVKDVLNLQLLFADFVNTWIVLDLVDTVIKLKEASEPLKIELGVLPEEARLDRFALLLAADPCWFGSLPNISNIADLKVALSKRMSDYRRYLNLNSLTLPQYILDSKTVIGDPIVKCADALKASGVLKEATKIFIRIDQYEQLSTLNVVGTMYGEGCQQLIHKALAARDSRVSYRVGTRDHGWPSPPRIFKTDDVLELKRDFDVVDMQALFRRRENVRTWIFPKFAKDIFVRRVRAGELGKYGKPSELSLTSALGKGLNPAERAMTYVSSAAGRAALIRKAIAALPNAVTAEWKEFILQTSEKSLLDAWLCCAWTRQRVGKRRVASADQPPTDGQMPWANKPYWYKERVQQALMQIASANRQALNWSGEEDVLSLSGGQILVFLFLLQHIWDAWMRDMRSVIEAELKFPIDDEVQSQGVLEASIEWRTKQIEGPNARQRRSFVDAIGEHFYVQLTGDSAMSYPGANGFSLLNGDLEVHKDIDNFLKQATSFGDLDASPHTSKKKGERRTKYYLDPILSPYFRIPTTHTKEPEYSSIEQVSRWLLDPSQRATNPSRSVAEQGDLWEGQKE